MAQRRSHRTRDTWGRPPEDPFMGKLLADPRRAARLSQIFTVGMILFWISLVIGMILAVAFMVFG